MNLRANGIQKQSEHLPDSAHFNAEAARVLRRLCEKGAVLAVAVNMEKAVIVRDARGATTRTGVVDRSVAEAMALKDWISAEKSGKITRYSITSSGRVALERYLEAETVGLQSGFAESQTAFETAGATPAHRFAGCDEDDGRRRIRYNFA